MLPGTISAGGIIIASLIVITPCSKRLRRFSKQFALRLNTAWASPHRARRAQTCAFSKQPRMLPAYQTQQHAPLPPDMSLRVARWT